jgi:hypothetical protein
MAKSYTATINLRTWKEHTCSCCNAVYSYLLIRRVTGSGPTVEKAQVAANKNLAKAIQRDVDLQPCPTCGLVQPDMIGQQRARAHIWIFSLALIVFIALIILRATNVLRANEATIAAIVICAIVAIAHFLVENKNRNKDIESNRRLAMDRVSSGAIRHTTPGRAGNANIEFIQPPRSMFHSLAVQSLTIAVLLVAAPEIVRSLRHWPLNADCYPPVVGPSDSTRIYMTDSIKSVKGYWRGRPNVTLTSEGAAPVPALAFANQNDWGSSISAKSSEKSNSTTPWVEVSVPNDPALAGKTVQCNIELQVEYPFAYDSTHFETEHEQLHRTAAMQLAPAGAGGRYNALWWQCTVGGMALLLVSGQILRGAARSLQRRANPTRVYNPDQVATAQDTAAVASGAPDLPNQV